MNLSLSIHISLSLSLSIYLSIYLSIFFTNSCNFFTLFISIDPNADYSYLSSYLVKSIQCIYIFLILFISPTKNYQSVCIYQYTDVSLLICSYLSINQSDMLFSLYSICVKNIETKALFTKAEINNRWNVNFLLNSLPHICDINSSLCFICWSSSENYVLMWSCTIVHLRVVNRRL